MSIALGLHNPGGFLVGLGASFAKKSEHLVVHSVVVRVRGLSNWVSGIAVATVLAVTVTMISSGTHLKSKPVRMVRSEHKRPVTGVLPTVRAASRPGSSRRPEVSPLGGVVQSYVSSRAGDVTAAVYDVATGKTWYLKPGDQQATASIVKVDIMATLLAQATSSGQPVSPENQNLLSSMIEVSDNDDATTLWTTAGGAPTINAFNGSIGMVNTTPSTCLSCAGFDWPGWGLTTTTAADQITLLRHLVLPNTEIGNAQRQDALGLMENVSPAERWGVTAGVPAGVTVALKNGWVPLSDSLWQINSMGWIDGAGRNYLIAVLTDGNATEDYGIATIEGLSNLVWTAMGSK